MPVSFCPVKHPAQLISMDAPGQRSFVTTGDKPGRAMVEERRSTVRFRQAAEKDALTS